LVHTDFFKKYAGWRGATGLSVASPLAPLRRVHPLRRLGGLSTTIPARVLDSSLNLTSKFIVTVLFASLAHFSLQGQSSNEKPNQPAQLFELGEKALQAKAYKTALAHYNECLRLDPYFWDAYFGRAMSKEKLNDPKGALTDYNIFLESKPDNMEALFTRAVLRYNYGQWAVAREDFLKLMTMPKGETNAVFYQTDQVGSTNKIFTAQGNIASTYLNYLGLIDWKMMNYKRAILYLDSAIKVNPQGVDYWINRGIVKQSSRDTLGAVSDFRQALKVDPENSLVTHNLAVLSGFTGDAKETERMLTEAIEKNPKLPYSYAERGYLRMKMNNWKGALTDFDQATLLDANEPDNWLNRGIAKEKLKDLNGALADYTQAIKIKSDYERAWLNRGNLLTKMNRLKEAIEDYSLAIHYYPEYGLAFYNRALAKHKLGNLKEACQDLLQAQKLEVRIDKKVMGGICK
jgi:tetratricopeptide (TPR) repeat protein